MRRIMFVLVFGVCLGLFSQVNPDTLPEKYVKKVIIEAKWGNGPGEFGLDPLPESYEYTTYFTVGPNGNIYIEDPNNCRINVYTKTGKFLREIKIPGELLTIYGGDTIAPVLTIGVDSEGYLYLAPVSSQVFGFKNDYPSVVKLDKDGKIIDWCIFEGPSVNPHCIYIDEKKDIYLWGNWYISPLSPYTAAIPVRFGKNTSITLKNENIITISFEKKKAIKLSRKKIYISSKVNPFTFAIKDSLFVYYTGNTNFVFQDLRGKVKEKLSIYPRYYPRGYGFSYKGKDNIMVNVLPVFDKDLNIYWIAGTPEGLKVIKYIINEEVWK